MKKLFLFILACLFMSMAFAQDSKSAMEKRSRDLCTAINSTNEKDWIKYIEENFSPALIKKPMKKQVQVSEQGDVSKSSGSTSEAEGTVQQKAQMFRQLHTDFTNAKIISIKAEDHKVTMTIESRDGLRGKFNLGFEKDTNLIEALGIEIVQEQ